ncbi:MGT family glycosyltransferase [Nocardia terpenica]|uniref:macrolide family glycosyltransferase n=1 Tax=Nocardia terpenica TaxID=455432 RepID=UPI0018946437|nr:macrolide family glycosyltransferase [Nocardia terpenica]MBF6063746.1 MGT family glycosyltransferase [Nocardia terpenica]MBF6107122.1 MGT family glycosyltransferase [Nocardia terpenica]MBF6114295.1 MGT family glycosyltransferase [Nocardia terpenica]MBF6121618.1 MGT family glycosyltransferase [Nocardia terpenica]MBF6154033.1 MGT family glycosyltransferase [Nocardia terpenica]
MAHILLIQYPASGHINPTLPVVEELVRRGHRVSFVVSENYREIVEATGARMLAYPSLVPPGWSGVEIPLHPSGDELARAHIDMIHETLTPLPSIVASLGADRPDVVVYDVLGCAAGRMLSLAWKVPSVVVCPTFAENETYSPYTAAADIPAPGPDHPLLRQAAAVVRTALDAWGLRHVTVPEFLSGAGERCWLVFLPRAFQLGENTFDERYHFVGPCLRSGADDTGWSPPPSGRPVVLVSLGTLHYDGSAALLRRAVEATQREGAHAVVALGEVDPAALGPLGEHVELHRRVPQLAVLRHAAAFVSHAGMNSTMEALAHGVPLVDLPQTGEQRMVARRVSGLGLGCALDPETATAAHIARALHLVRTSAAVRDRVARMRSAVAAGGGARAAADLIESRIAVFH